MTGFELPFLFWVVIQCVVRVCYRKSLLVGHSRDPGDDRHDFSSEEVLTDPELVRHEGFQDEGKGK